MIDIDAGAPAASFESKWGAAYPELELGLRFVTADQRAAQSAFECLVHELEHAAFGIRDAEPAALKLQWWLEEFERARHGAARHPLTQVLAARVCLDALAVDAWSAVVAAAFAQRDPQAAGDRAALLEQPATMYRAIARIEVVLFGHADADADAESLARARSLAHALRETAALGDALRDGRMPLPLDLLARHRLARGDLGEASPKLAAALREWLAGLAGELARVRVAAPVPAAAVAADRWRARRAGRAERPLERLREDLGRLPVRAAWAAWRAGHDVRRRPGALPQVIDAGRPSPH